MTEQNIFVYKLFFDITYFLLIFHVQIATPPEKSHPPTSQQFPSKSWGLVKPHPPFLVGGSTPQQKEGVHTMLKALFQ